MKALKWIAIVLVGLCGFVILFVAPAERHRTVQANYTDVAREKATLETEKTRLQNDLDAVKTELREARGSISQLQESNEILRGRLESGTTSKNQLIAKLCFNERVKFSLERVKATKPLGLYAAELKLSLPIPLPSDIRIKVFHDGNINSLEVFPPEAITETLLGGSYFQLKIGRNFRRLVLFGEFPFTILCID